MKSSSSISIGNGNNCTENRKAAAATTTTSLSSSPLSSANNINKGITKANTVLIKPSKADKNDIRRQEQQLNEFIQPANSFFINSASTFQSEGSSSTFQFELTPKTVNQINHYQSNTTTQHRPRLQWTKRHGSSKSKSHSSSATSSIIFLRSSIDLNATMTTTNMKNDSSNMPDIAITEMTNQDFHDQYQPYVEKVFQKSNNQTDPTQILKSNSMNFVTDAKHNNHVDYEKDKVFTDQASQALLVDSTENKTIKSATPYKKIKSATKRPKQSSATSITTQPIISASSPNRSTPQNELNTITTTQKSLSASTKVDDNNAAKNLITIDTSKARSNLEVVRFCIRELGWRECFISANVDSDIYWHSSSFHEGNVNFAFNSGRVNKFPGMNDLLRKVHLTRLLNNMRLLFPNDFDFYPKTWFLPEQTQQFKDDVRYIHQQDKKHNRSLTTFIIKPSVSGKLTYQSSPIDEEIKKPLVLETLKIALPKKKLHTFARHAQLQVNDELMAQRVEKVAQRRVEERTEKIKSARKTRFDLKSNPFFSRPSDTVTKEFMRLQQEQQEQLQQQRVLISSPTHPMDPSHSNHGSYMSSPQLSSHFDGKSKIISSKIMKKTKKLVDSTDDDESGMPDARIIETNQNIRSSSLYPSTSSPIKRSTLKSASNRSVTTTEAAVVEPIRKLKMIFPLTYKTKYRHLFLLDKIAYIYIQLVIMLGHKTMTGAQFRNFANVCGIINETITAPTIDILYYQILRKWQQFVSRTTSAGLPFSAFIEAFFLLSQRKFPSSPSLLDSVSQLVNTCIRNLNSCLQAPSSPLIQQSNQYLLHRASRINSSTNPSSTNNRSSVVTLRSTTAATHRTINAPSSAPTPRTHQTTPSATAITKINNDEKPKQSAKSVFPLFFNVL
ncbi:unnamed protein product [Rotaria magnacalcarata]|uniref:Uncharacterized protein n=1 Tax=Rotaria magnacalcarata TaxID=392030 RepID=A0A8S2N7L9_9BILA|nr:unnamed protein product [Rotaria magnacalcarata]